jgi:hypothetical protein
MENAVATIGHEIAHIKQVKRGDANLSESQAEEAGLKFLEMFRRKVRR